MAKEQSVAVTHFINPQLFWYHKLDVPNDNFHKIIQIEQQLLALYKSKPKQGHFRPAVGDVVVVRFISWNKYIRARVDHVAQFSSAYDEYIVWALDYGFPFQTKLEFMRRIPDSMTVHIDHIRCGGLANILPGEKEFDLMEGNAVMTVQEQWNQRACDTLGKLISEGASVTFVEQFQMRNGQYWGDLKIFNHIGKTFSACKTLVDINVALKHESNFEQVCLSLKTIKKSCWLSNNGEYKLTQNNMHTLDITHKESHTIRKVEDWCKRNERGFHNMSLDLGESPIDESVDDITFEDSISLNHASIDDFECPEEEQGFIRLGGRLNKLKSNILANAKYFPIPDDSAFEINAGKSDGSKIITEETDNDFASSVVSSSVSNRKRKLIEMRKKMAIKQAEQKSTPPNSISNGQSEDLCNFAGLTLTNQHPLDSRSSPRSEISIKSVRAKQLLALRRKYALPKDISNDMPRNEPNNDVSPSSKSTNTTYQNKEKRTASSIVSYHNTADDMKDNITSTSSQIDNKSVRTKELVGLPIIHCTDEVSYNINNNEHMNEKTSAMLDHNRQKNFQFPDLQNEKAAIGGKKKPKDPFDGFTLIPAGYDFANLCRYKNEDTHWHRRATTLNLHIPHDNLNPNEDVVQNISSGGNSSSSSVMMNATPSDGNKTVDNTVEISKYVLNQNVRHIRSHTDKYKKPISTDIDAICGNKLQKNILDSSVPNLDDSVLKPLTTNLDDSKVYHKCVTKEYNVPTSAGGDIPQCKTSDQSFIKKNKRRPLKPPDEQMNKIDELLRRANFEKDRGNTNILDLQNLNTSSRKSDSDSFVERLLLNNSNSSTGREFKENKTSSNKRALIEKRLLEKSPNNKKGEIPVQEMDNLKLERIEKVLNYELEVIKNPINSKTFISFPQAEAIREICGEKKIQTKFMDHLVLAHSKVPVYPLEKLADAFFLPEIHDEMINMHVSKVYRIQAYSWSNLLRGNSLFVVNPIKSGKTWCYLPPICNLVSYRIQNTAVPQSYGPVAIIIVPSSTTVEIVNSYCRRLLINSKKNVTTVPSYGIRNIREVKIQLLNGCGILVATPASLLRLLQERNREPLINPDRLHHLVIDDLDLILARSKNDFKVVFQIILKMVKKQKQESVPLQIVVTSRDWNYTMLSIMNCSNEPLLLIGDFLEAAVYGKANISIKLRPKENKISSILRFISKCTIEHERILIICNLHEEMDDVVQAITDSGQACIGYGQSSPPEVRVTIDEWNQKSLCSHIVVCTDEVLPELKLQKVKILIHYSMPKSWTRFTMRFSTMAKCYENFVAKGFGHTISKEALTSSLILLDEENSIQLPRLIDFMKKHDQIEYIHPDILSVSKRVRIESEESRMSKGTLLCPFLLEFGNCDEPRCDHRHNFIRFDKITKTDDIPISGDMRIKILKVFSPTHYTARLLEHKAPNTIKWKTIRRSDEAALFGMQLNMHYMDPDNWVLHWPLKQNDLCIYKVSDTYQRALVLDVPHLQDTDIVKKVKVTIRLIDLGTVITSCKSEELFVCDEKFKEFPYQAIDIRLDGVIPYDNERTWDSKATKVVQKWIMTDIAKNESVYVHINFTFAKTVWVKNVIVMERLPTVGQYIYRVNLKRSLIEKNFGCLRSWEKSRHVRDIVKEFGLLDEQDEDIDDNTVNYDSPNSLNLIKFPSNDEDSICSITVADNVSPLIEDPLENKQFQKVQRKSCELDENWDNCHENNSENEIFIPISKIDKHIYTNSKSINNIEISEDVQEKWCKLPLNTITKVEIGDELENGNWANIFMQIVDDVRKRKFQELLHIINEHIKNLKKYPKKTFDATWFKSMQNCIVKYQNIYCRAKVHAVYGDESKRLYRFFLCDIACFIIVNEAKLYSDFLYETERKIVEYTPYQAVHCTLAGIKLKEFGKRHPVVKKHIFAFPVIERDYASTNTIDLKMHSFDILLYECESEKITDFQKATMLNTILVDYGLASADSNTKHYLQLSNIMPKPDNSKPNVNNEENDELVSYEELVTILESSDVFYEEKEELEDINLNEINIIPFNETKTIYREDKEINASQMQNAKTYSKISTKNTYEDVEEIENELLNSSSQSGCDQSPKTHSNRSGSAIVTLPPPLTALHKRPQTEWYDTDYLIYIVIRTPDIKDYYLEVTKNSLLFSAFINEQEHVLILNFLGTVEPEFVTHEIRGLNVVVRLLKSIFIKWPRLLEQSTKFPWLTYNYNAIDTMERIQLQQKIDLAFKDSNLWNSQIDSEEDDDEAALYQTYTPIINTDDINDPVADIL